MLLGIVGQDGLVQNLSTRIEIDADFVTAASKIGTPEARFRFASTCVEGKCSQWTGSACGIVERVLTAITDQGVAPAAELPRCVIRGSCRWYSQRGETACRACVYVVTDQTEACA